ncbi:unnamed protein product, partial [Prorocentrum cordatum]
ELNATVEAAATRVVRERVGGGVQARLVPGGEEALPLVFFGDGVKLGKEPFRPYGQREAQQLLDDIMDGFFPYALKDDHPGGVVLKDAFWGGNLVLWFHPQVPAAQ